MGNPTPEPMMPNPTRSNSRIWLIMIAVLFFILLICTALVALTYFVYLRPISSRHLNASELSALLKVEDVVEHYGFEQVKGGKVLANQEQTLDGVKSTSYEFESDEFYVLNELEVSKFVREARESYVGTQLVTAGIRKLDGGDVQYREDKSLFKWGDEMQFWHLMEKNETYGFQLIARKQRTIITIVVGGIKLDKECAEDFLMPKLDQMYMKFQN